MLAYCTLGTDDLDRAVAFYDALMAEIGAKRIMDVGRGWIYGTEQTGAPMLGILTPYDTGKPAAGGNGPMVALAAGSRDEVDRVYQKAIDLGGTDEGPAGERMPTFYAGYFRDLDGNKLAIVYFG